MTRGTMQFVVCMKPTIHVAVLLHEIVRNVVHKGKYDLHYRGRLQIKIICSKVFLTVIYGEDCREYMYI